MELGMYFDRTIGLWKYIIKLALHTIMYQVYNYIFWYKFKSNIYIIQEDV